VPAKYNWPTLLKKDGDDLFDHYRHMLESLGKNFSPSPLNSSPIEGEELWRKASSVEKGLLGLIFNKSQNKFQDPSKLRRLVVDLIDHIRAAFAFAFLIEDRHLVAIRSSPSSLNSSPSR
jgi:type I restriction enzyme M protein